jgi:glyoxylate reductase
MVTTRPAEIAVLGRIPEVGLALLREVGQVWAWDRDEPIPAELRDARLATADAAVTLLTNVVDAGFLSAAPRLKVVANVAVGFNNIDVAACAARGVLVANTPGVLTDATADLGMALILMVTRRLAEGERLIRSRQPWQWGMFMLLGAGLQGRRLGIIGMGAIGQALARRARAFEMEVVYHSRRPISPDLEAPTGAHRVALDELLASSDVVSVNCPYNAETHHLIDAEALARMRSTAYLVNTARGPIVHEHALADALRDGVIAGAALDVYEHEPAVDPGLLDLDNVVLVPHLGSATHETRDAMATLAARNVAAVLVGDRPLTPVG